MSQKKLEDFCILDRPARVIRMGGFIDDLKQKQWDNELMAARARHYFESIGVITDDVHNFPQSYKNSSFSLPEEFLGVIAKPEDLI